MILAVLPAPNHVRLDKLAAEVGKSVWLATEQEFSSLFPDCELGAMPRFGSLYNLPVYVDESLAADEEIVFNGGTHRDAIRMRYDDFVRLANAKICSFAQKGLGRRPASLLAGCGTCPSVANHVFACQPADDPVEDRRLSALESRQ